MLGAREMGTRQKCDVGLLFGHVSLYSRLMNKSLPSNEMISEIIARKVFAKRGNHSEAHICELELAAIINSALETKDHLAQVLDAASV